jgi:hypothetical protein
MAESSWSAVATAAVTVIDAATTCDVFDGPPTSGDQLFDYVAVGSNPADSLEPTAGQFAQQYRGLGPGASRSEQGDIRCFISSWSGDSDLPALRIRVLDIFDDISAAIRDNPTLGLSGVRAPEVEIRAGSIMQGYTNQGARVDLPFILSYTSQV